METIRYPSSAAWETEEEAVEETVGKLAITVVPGDWGRARPGDIVTILTFVAEELFMDSPSRPVQHIVVEYAESGPHIFYKQMPRGVIQIHLSARGTDWIRYAYQFAHELCHVLCQYDRAVHGMCPNKWFEEVLCETAALFVLRRLSQASEPYSYYENWGLYAPRFADYAEKRIATFKLHPQHAQADLAYWYRFNSYTLRTAQYPRKTPALIVIRLLSLFEENPTNWGALDALNSGEQYKSKSFESYLRDWYNHSVAQHQGFVAEVANLFAIKVK